MKTKLAFLCAVLITATGLSQNLINTSSWVAGESGATNDYWRQGSVAQNSRVNFPGPLDNQDVVVWQAQADGASGMSGGFIQTGVVLDASKTYRFTSWMRSTGPNNCNNYSGFVPYRDSDGSRITSTERLNGSVTTWPYFSARALPNDKWYLVVGYIHPASYTGSSNLGGIYDPQTVDSNNPTLLPSTVFDTQDFKFTATESAVRVQFRNFMWACATGDFMYAYEPRIEEMNGQEVPLIDLLGGGSDSGPGGGETVWNSSGGDINYTDGNVGIGTDSPDEALTVDGKIHTREVRVDLQAPFVPDYVFYDDYELRTLKEVQKYIDQHGHLPNIPSAAEFERDGMNLKEMDLKLLEKIEELTLYILEQNKKQQLLDKRIKVLEKK